MGRLGFHAFPAGFYVYVGSALGPGGLAARVGRHLRSQKRLHWHIDYFLERATICQVWGAITTERRECGWAAALLASPGAGVVLPRFGASDCHCPTHLVYWEAQPDFARLLQCLGASRWYHVPG